MTDTIPTIPNSLERSIEAMVVAEELTDRIARNELDSEDRASWTAAKVRSLETFDHISFTDEERKFFDDLLSQLKPHVTWYPIPAYSQYEINDEGVVRSINGQLQELHDGPSGSYYLLQSDYGSSSVLLYLDQMIEDLQERLSINSN